MSDLRIGYREVALHDGSIDTLPKVDALVSSDVFLAVGASGLEPPTPTVSKKAAIGKLFIFQQVTTCKLTQKPRP